MTNYFDTDLETINTEGNVVEPIARLSSDTIHRLVIYISGVCIQTEKTLQLHTEKVCYKPQLCTLQHLERFQ